MVRVTWCAPTPAATDDCGWSRLALHPTTGTARSGAWTWVSVRSVRSAAWLLTLDADVRPSPALARSLVARAERRHLRLLSVATAQRLSGAVEGLLHPALLATLVYRFGRPGGATRAPGAALANGQCCLIRRDLLHELGGFQTLRDSLCEDVTLARLAARAGDAVGFYEADGLIDVAMYADWRDAWQQLAALARYPRCTLRRGWLAGPARGRAGPGTAPASPADPLAERARHGA